ncbi:MAG: Glucosyl-3-phosphoglycerate synthase [Actinomycetota bacterium]|nr:Glucosyl-3-phosphoglycerate synthase [Actinomycetota bacterium]
MVNELQQMSADWLAGHTSTAHDWPVAQVAAAVRDCALTVAVVLPALNEEATVGQIVATIVAELTGPDGFVTEVVVVDSGSTDATAKVAAEAGARVVVRQDVLTHIPPVPGKGESMWRGLAATTSDIVVFVDADLQSFSTDYIAGLVGPLAAKPDLQLVKAVYERPLVAGETVVPAGGGRVTELVARPLINRFWPELAAVVQPLAGEYAGRRGLLESLPFPCGYGVEIALMVDTYERFGLTAIAQVDLGVRVHRHHHEQGLGVMAAEILDTALRRVPGLADPAGNPTLTQFERTVGGYQPRSRALSTLERPPLRDVRSVTGPPQRPT